MLAQAKAFPFYAEFPVDKAIVTTPQQLAQMMAELAAAPAIAFDFETSGLAWYRDSRACGLALAHMPSGNRTRCWYIPFRHATGEQQLAIEQIWPAVYSLLASDKLKVAHNIKFDEHMATREKWPVLGPRYDTMIGARFYDENRSAALKERAVTDLGFQDAKDSEKALEVWVIAGAKAAGLSLDDYRSRFGYSTVPIQVAGVYACFDVDYTLRLWQKYEAQHAISTNYSRVWQTEMELTRVLHDMEEAGLPVDIDYIRQLSKTVRERKEQLVREMGLPFNLASDDELRDFLLKTLNVPLSKRTKGGQLAVDAEVLRYFSGTWPVLGRILEWRDADKIDTTYTDSLLQRVGHDGMLHGDFQQVGTNTGRLSCRNPNFQNFSSDDNDRAIAATGKALADGGADPYSVRRIFVVRSPRMPRFYWDYSQIELRVLAYYSRDPVLTQAYLTGEDIHSRTAKEVWGSDDKVFRRRAKIINFGLSYCMTEVGFARQAGISEVEAAHFMGVFFQKYAGISQLRERFWEFCRKNGCQFLNRFGRPRRIRDLDSLDKWERIRAERQAIGTLIQGTAAELTKESLVRIWQWLKRTGIPVLLVNTVHDEIQADVPAEHIVETVTKVKAEMERYPEFAPIPIIASVDYTETNWAEKKALKM